MINGGIDYTIDTFKKIESKYKRNIDEWLCNLYIEVKNIDLVDFHPYQSQICFKRENKKKKKKPLSLRQRSRSILFNLGIVD